MNKLEFHNKILNLKKEKKYIEKKIIDLSEEKNQKLNELKNNIVKYFYNLFSIPQTSFQLEYSGTHILKLFYVKENIKKIILEINFWDITKEYNLIDSLNSIYITPTLYKGNNIDELIILDNLGKIARILKNEKTQVLKDLNLFRKEYYEFYSKNKSLIFKKYIPKDKEFFYLIKEHWETLTKSYLLDLGIKYKDVSKSYMLEYPPNFCTTNVSKVQAIKKENKYKIYIYSYLNTSPYTFEISNLDKFVDEILYWGADNIIHYE